MKIDLAKELIELKSKINDLYVNTEEGQRSLFLNTPFEVALQNNYNIIKCRLEHNNCYFIGNHDIIPLLSNDFYIFLDVYKHCRSKDFELLIELDGKEFDLFDERLFDYFGEYILSCNMILMGEVSNMYSIYSHHATII